MSKYKVWTIEDILTEIKRLEELTGFKLEESTIIKINNRLTACLGRCVMKYVRNSSKEQSKIEIVSLEFSKYLVDGTVSEKEVLDTILHEFIHAKVDCGKHKPNKHNNIWRQEFIKYGGSGNRLSYSGEFNPHETIRKTEKYKIKAVKDKIVNTITGMCFILTNDGVMPAPSPCRVSGANVVKFTFRKTDYGFILYLGDKYGHGVLEEQLEKYNPNLFEDIYNALSNSEIFYFIDKLERVNDRKIKLYINLKNIWGMEVKLWRTTV